MTIHCTGKTMRKQASPILLARMWIGTTLTGGNLAISNKTTFVFTLGSASLTYEDETVHSTLFVMGHHPDTCPKKTGQ